LIARKDIWAGASKTMRRDGRIVRGNASNPETGTLSLPQKVIARWPHDDIGINLGRFR
jgi:hypothetical protein